MIPSQLFHCSFTIKISSSIRIRRVVYYQSDVRAWPWDWTCNPGKCSDRELNWPPLGAQDDAQPMEALRLGIVTLFSQLDRNICFSGEASVTLGEPLSPTLPEQEGFLSFTYSVLVAKNRSSCFSCPLSPFCTKKIKCTTTVFTKALEELLFALSE